MSFFSEERSLELKELFFESASELLQTLNEDGLGQIQIGMNLDDAVSMGLLNENPNMNSQCDFVFPAVGAGIPDGVSVMVVKGKVARIDVDTGAVTTDDGAKIGDTEDRLKTIYGDDLQVARADPHVDNLTALFYEPIIKAKRGGHGMGKKMYGRAAPDKVVKVPVGTVVYRASAPAAPRTLGIEQE